MIDINKLNALVENPDLEKDFQEVFSFVEGITGHNICIDHLTPTDIETWNSKFGEVIDQLIHSQCQ